MLSNDLHRCFDAVHGLNDIRQSVVSSSCFCCYVQVEQQLGAHAAEKQEMQARLTAFQEAEIIALANHERYICMRTMSFMTSA